MSRQENVYEIRMLDRVISLFRIAVGMKDSIIMNVRYINKAFSIV